MTGAATVIGLCGLYSATDLRLIGSFPTTMRTSPSLYQGSGSSYYTLYSDSNGYAFNSFSKYKLNKSQQKLAKTSGVIIKILNFFESFNLTFEMKLDR